MAASGRPEPGDPLYVSTADEPELRLIAHQLLGPENYLTWAQEFRQALITKDKDGFLDGTTKHCGRITLDRGLENYVGIYKGNVQEIGSSEIFFAYPNTYETEARKHVYRDMLHQALGAME